MAEVKRGNPSVFSGLSERINSLDGYETKVGWFENAQYPDGTPVAYVAAIQEFGSGKIPPRLGMRLTIEKKKNEWSKIAQQLAAAILSGKKDSHTAMDDLGDVAEGNLLEHITSSPGPALSELTLAIRKMRRDGKKITGTLVWETAARLKAGENVPLSSNTRTLDDTNMLISHLTHEVTSV